MVAPHGGLRAHKLQEVDFDGDGDEAVAVAFDQTQAAGTQRRAGACEVRVLDAHGRLRTRLRPEEEIQSWSHPFRRAFHVVALPLDLDSDGWLELVVNYTHSTFYPAGLFVYWPKAERWEHVLDHWGHIYCVTAIPGRRSRLRFVAVNNALGFAPVLAEIELVPFDRRETESASRTPRRDDSRPDRQLPAGAGRCTHYSPYPRRAGRRRMG